EGAVEPAATPAATRPQAQPPGPLQAEPLVANLSHGEAMAGKERAQGCGRERVQVAGNVVADPTLPPEPRCPGGRIREPQDERASGPEHAGDLRERGRGGGEMLDDVGEQDRVHARCRESDGVKVALAYVEVPALAGDPYRLWARLDAEHLRIPTVSDGAQEVAGAAAHVQHPCRRPQVAPQRSHIAPA